MFCAYNLFDFIFYIYYMNILKKYCFNIYVTMEEINGHFYLLRGNSSLIILMKDQRD